MSSKGSQGSVNTTSGPPAWAQPYYTAGMSQAADLYGASPGPTPYPGAQVAPFSPLQEQGMGQVASLSQSNPYNASAGNTFAALESGALLDPTSNPALQGLVGQGMNRIQENAGTQFAGAGRNLNASAPAQAEQMASLENQVYGNSYNNTLNQMTGALGQANNLTQGQYMPAQMLGQAGQAVQTQAQNLIDQNQNVYNQYQNLPYGQLSNYMSTIASIPVGKQLTQPLYTNNAAAGLGAALTAANIYGSMRGGGKGAQGAAVNTGTNSLAGGGFGAFGGGIL